MSIFGSFANVNQVNPLNNLEYADLLFCSNICSSRQLIVDLKLYLVATFIITRSFEYAYVSFTLKTYLNKKYVLNIKSFLHIFFKDKPSIYNSYYLILQHDFRMKTINDIWGNNSIDFVLLNRYNKNIVIVITRNLIISSNTDSVELLTTMSYTMLIDIAGNENKR